MGDGQDARHRLAIVGRAQEGEQLLDPGAVRLRLGVVDEERARGVALQRLAEEPVHLVERRGERNRIRIEPEAALAHLVDGPAC
jgi:hypothetical protein